MEKESLKDANVVTGYSGKTAIIWVIVMIVKKKLQKKKQDSEYRSIEKIVCNDSENARNPWKHGVSRHYARFS